MSDAKDVINASLKKAQRKLQAVHGDLARISAAPRLLYETELLKSAKIKAYDSFVIVSDYGVDPPAPLRIALDPGIALHKQIDKRCKQARRLMRAEGAALARLLAVEQEVAALTALAAAAERGEAIAPETMAALRPPPPRKKNRADAPAPRPYRVYLSASGRPIWVGRSGRNNELMTFKEAGPHDQWLHAVGYAGAHVVVPKKRDEQIDQETLHEACALAAHFSKAPPGDYVEVAVAERKFVRKFKGASTGQVSVTRETHRRLRNDPEAAKAVMARKPASA